MSAAVRPVLAVPGAIVLDAISATAAGVKPPGIKLGTRNVGCCLSSARMPGSTMDVVGVGVAATVCVITVGAGATRLRRSNITVGAGAAGAAVAVPRATVGVVAAGAAIAGASVGVVEVEAGVADSSAEGGVGDAIAEPRVADATAGVVAVKAGVAGATFDAPGASGAGADDFGSTPKGSAGVGVVAPAGAEGELTLIAGLGSPSIGEGLRSPAPAWLCPTP